MIIRAATEADAGTLAEIYAHHVLHGFGTFEEAPPAPAEMDARRRGIVERGLPYLVGESEGRVLGYAYASPYRPRVGYRYTLEDTVYVAHDAVGRGVGKSVLAGVVAACETLGVRQLVAVIGDSGNAASIGLHASLGFERAGLGRSFGFKHGRWVDVVWMQKALNGGDSCPPGGPGIKVI